MNGNAARDIVKICRRMYDRGYVVATEGNVSVRLASGDILVTGARVRKREITARDLVRVTPGGGFAGPRRPSSETALHRLIYRKRADVRAVVHAHPPCCTAFALARKAFPADTIPEVLVEFGKVPLVPFAVPSTGDLSRAITPFVMKSDFFLLANHGVVSCGRDLEEAYDLVERAEHAARVLLLSGFLGGAKKLPARDRATLHRISIARKDARTHGRKNNTGR
jgi:L-fuculose-phosphate aldolase